MEPPAGRFASSERVADQRLQFLLRQHCVIGDVHLLAALRTNHPELLQVDSRMASTPTATRAGDIGDITRCTPDLGPDVSRRVAVMRRDLRVEADDGYRPVGRSSGNRREDRTIGRYRGAEPESNLRQGPKDRQPADVAGGGFLPARLPLPPPFAEANTTVTTTSGHFVRTVDEARRVSPRAKAPLTVQAQLDAQDMDYHHGVPGPPAIKYGAPTEFSRKRRQSPVDAQPAPRGPPGTLRYRSGPEAYEPVSYEPVPRGRREEAPAAPANMAVGSMTPQDIADLVKSTLASSLKELTARHPAALGAAPDGAEVSRMVQSIISDVTAPQLGGTSRGYDRPGSPGGFVNKRQRLEDTSVDLSSQGQKPYRIPPNAAGIGHVGYRGASGQDRSLQRYSESYRGDEGGVGNEGRDGNSDARLPESHRAVDPSHGYGQSEALRRAPPDVIDRRSIDPAGPHPVRMHPDAQASHATPRIDDVYGQELRRTVASAPALAADPYSRRSPSARRAGYDAPAYSEDPQHRPDEAYSYPPRDSRATGSASVGRAIPEGPHLSRSREHHAQRSPRHARDGYPEAPRHRDVRREQHVPQREHLRPRERDRGYPPRDRISPRSGRDRRSSPPLLRRSEDLHGGSAYPSRSPPPRARAAKELVPQVSPVPILKLRSGGSRVADRRRSAPNARPLIKPNEDAFSVEYCTFAVGDGFEGKAGAPGTRAFSSAAFTQDLVTTATNFAARQLSGYVTDQGRSNTLLPPVRVLQQATNMVQSSGAAAVLLGVLNPLTGILSIGKLGDVGYVVLRPPPEGSHTDTENDLEV
jgi:hypothetical protein